MSLVVAQKVTFSGTASEGCFKLIITFDFNLSFVNKREKEKSTTPRYYNFNSLSGMYLTLWTYEKTRSLPEEELTV